MQNEDRGFFLLGKWVWLEMGVLGRWALCLNKLVLLDTCGCLLSHSWGATGMNPCYRQEREAGIHLHELTGANEGCWGQLQFTLLALPPGPANSPILVLIHEPLFLLLQKKFFRRCRDGASSLNNHIFTVIKRQIPQLPKCMSSMNACILL